MYDVPALLTSHISVPTPRPLDIRNVDDDHYALLLSQHVRYSAEYSAMQITWDKYMGTLRTYDDVIHARHDVVTEIDGKIWIIPGSLYRATSAPRREVPDWERVLLDASFPSTIGSLALKELGTRLSDLVAGEFAARAQKVRDDAFKPYAMVGGVFREKMNSFFIERAYSYGMSVMSPMYRTSIDDMASGINSPERYRTSWTENIAEYAKTWRREYFEQALKYGKKTPEIVRHDSTTSFMTYMKKRRSVIQPASLDDLENLVLPAFVDASRNWGIEVEHPDCAGIYAPNECWERKDDSSIESMNDSEMSECEYSREEECGYCENETTEYCGTDYTCDYCEGGGNGGYDSTGEFVSDVLMTMRDDGLINLCDELDGRGTNDSAGVHVHVNAPEFAPAGAYGYEKDSPEYRRGQRLIANAAHAWALIDPILTPLYQRQKSYYAKPYDASQALMAARFGKGRNDSFYPERYMTMNFCALRAHGTIEFRAMGPVYDANYLHNWAHLVRRFVSSIVDGKTPADFAKAVTFADVLAVIEWDKA